MGPPHSPSLAEIVPNVVERIWPKWTALRPRSIEVVPTLVDAMKNVGRDRLKFAQNRPESGQMRYLLDQAWRMSVELAPDSVELASDLAHIGHVWPEGSRSLAQVGPSTARCCPESAQCQSIPNKYGRGWAHFGPNSIDFGQMSVKCGPHLADVSPCVATVAVEVGPKSIEVGPHMWPDSAPKVGRVRPNLADVGRKWSQMWPKLTPCIGIRPGFSNVGPGFGRSSATSCGTMITRESVLSNIAHTHTQKRMPMVGRWRRGTISRTTCGACRCP